LKKAISLSQRLLSQRSRCEAVTLLSAGTSNLRDSSDISARRSEKGVKKSPTAPRAVRILADPRLAWGVALLLAALTLLWLPADGAEDSPPSPYRDGVGYIPLAAVGSIR
jgi:hypothetical protein